MKANAMIDSPEPIVFSKQYVTAFSVGVVDESIKQGNSGYLFCEVVFQCEVMVLRIVLNEILN
jgi:hypothetical protein